MEISTKGVEIFLRHLENGTRPYSAGKSAAPWTNQDFPAAVQVSKAYRDSTESNRAFFTDKTFGNWKKGDGPGRPTVLGMAEVFFGDDAALAAMKDEFLTHWDPRRRTPAPAPARSAGLVPDIDHSPTEQRFLQMLIDPPPQGATAASFELLVQLRSAFDRHWDDDNGLEIAWVLKRYTVLLSFEGCQPVGTPHGDPRDKKTGIRWIPGGWEIEAAGSEPCKSFNDVLTMFARTSPSALPSVLLRAQAHVRDLYPRTPRKADASDGKVAGVRDAFLKLLHDKGVSKTPDKLELGSAGLRWVETK